MLWMMINSSICHANLILTVEATYKQTSKYQKNIVDKFKK